jgi:hypothetical protein
MTAPTVQFLREQDGKPERVLKEQFIEFVRRGSEVQRACLAQVRFDGQLSVALSLKAIHGPDPNLVNAIGEIFKSIFVQQEHLDIIFLKDDQELALAKACSRFYAIATP